MDEKAISAVIKQFFRFGIVGILATIIHYGVYLWLLYCCTEYLAYSIGYTFSFIINFILTCFFTFKVKASVKRVAGFMMAHFINYSLQLLLLYVFLWCGFSSTSAPIPVYCICVPVNFILVRYVFSSR